MSKIPLNYSIDALRVMSDTERLGVIRDPMTPPTTLTYALELYGQGVSAQEALQVMRDYWQHPKPYVREGVVYGLEPHVADEGVRAFLTDWAAVEPIPELREAVTEALDSA